MILYCICLDESMYGSIWKLVPAIDSTLNPIFGNVIFYFYHEYIVRVDTFDISNSELRPYQRTSESASIIINSVRRSSQSDHSRLRFISN